VRRRLLLIAIMFLIAGLVGGVGGLLATVPPESYLPGVEPQADDDRVSDQRPTTSDQRPATSDQRPVTSGQRPGHTGQPQLPPGHPPLSRAPDTHAPGLVQQRELRRRVADAVDLGRRARAGEQAAKDAAAVQLASEADPRVRQALATGEPPDLGRPRGWAPPVLPEPAATAEPGAVRAYWVTPDSRGGTYESTVTVDDAGRAQVETVYDADNGEHWHVRYPAWAYRDAQGRLVVDARGQPVECLQKPEWGWWSPDSMLIGKDGLIDMIDDKHDPGQGTSGANGSG
jgi:hypothetical protein